MKKQQPSGGAGRRGSKKYTSKPSAAKRARRYNKSRKYTAGNRGKKRSTTAWKTTSGRGRASKSAPRDNDWDVIWAAVSAVMNQSQQTSEPSTSNWPPGWQSSRSYGEPSLSTQTETDGGTTRSEGRSAWSDLRSQVTGLLKSGVTSAITNLSSENQPVESLSALLQSEWSGPTVEEIDSEASSFKRPRIEEADDEVNLPALEFMSTDEEL
jgi:hypothetical protein